jgi:regulator of sigma E protease
MEIFIAIIVLSVLILIHELGHFVAAKKAGLLVEEFGFGLPPRLWGKKIGDTIYSINWLPFGGFVKIYGETQTDAERTQTDAELRGRAFYEKSIRTRSVILVSGVFMNFLLGVFILSFLLTLGVPAVAGSKIIGPRLQDLHVEIMGIAKDSPAEKAGIAVGDRIVFLSFENEKVEVQSSSNVSDFVSRHKGKEITVGIQRNSSELSVGVFARETPPAGEGSLGIVMADLGILQYPWWQSPYEALRLAIQISWNVLLALGQIFEKLFREGRLEEGVAGPVGIVSLTEKVAKLGILKLLNFVALLSINLAVLNILPIPALDGGRMLFLLLEKIRGKPISRRFEAASHAVGMAVLLTLIMLISIQDIRRLL